MKECLSKQTADNSNQYKKLTVLVTNKQNSLRSYASPRDSFGPVDPIIFDRIRSPLNTLSIELATSMAKNKQMYFFFYPKRNSHQWNKMLTERGVFGNLNLLPHQLPVTCELKLLTAVTNKFADLEQILGYSIKWLAIEASKVRRKPKNTTLCRSRNKTHHS